MTACDEIGAGIAKQFADGVSITPTHDGCVVSLPTLTADGRRVFIYVEPCGDSAFRLHDAGHNAGELFVQGLHAIDGRIAKMAQRLGVTFEHHTLSVTVPRDRIFEGVIKLTQAQTAVTADALTHDFRLDEHPRTATRVGEALKAWKPAWVSKIGKNVKVEGRRRRKGHKFDFVAFRRDEAHRNVAVRVIPSTHSPEAQVGQYGFMVLDIQQAQRQEATWPRLAVVSRGERWSDEQLETVRSLSSDLLVVTRKDEARLGELIPKKMNALAQTA